MKILRETKIEGTQQAQQLGFQEVPFEVRLDTTVKISGRKQSGIKVSPPVDHQAAIQASALIRQLFLAQPVETIHTQANADRKKVAMLLEEE